MNFVFRILFILLDYNYRDFLDFYEKNAKFVPQENESNATARAASLSNILSHGCRSIASSMYTENTHLRNCAI